MPLSNQDAVNRSQSKISDMEGRMLVLEVVAMTSLALALDTSDEENAKIGKGVLYLIREAVDNKCGEVGLSEAATETAQTYAEELIRTAVDTLYPRQH